jgi:hypothetical protein
MDHQAIFDVAFANPEYTAIVTPDSAVNQVIRDAYDVDTPFTYTRTQLWDMEVKKAHYPDKYLRHVVRPGSLRTFNHTKDGHFERFIRISDQRMWKDLSTYTTVVEDVRLDRENHRAVFVGLPEVKTPEGGVIIAGKGQPIFHVEHCAVGPEDEPVNTWRIVHLTQERDGTLTEVFDKIGNTTYLRLFNEVYIREDLGRTLTRKEISN